VAFFASRRFSFFLARCRCFILLALLGFGSFAQAQVTYSEVERLLEAGRAEADKGDFTKALGHFNKAMGYLKQASPSHPLNEVVRREIRVTKGRSLVARYRNRSGLKLVNKDQLLPLDQEPSDVLVRQRLGTVLAREVWQPKKISEQGEYIGFGRRLTVLPGGGVELDLGEESKFSLRTVDAASLALPMDKVFDLHSGAFAISSANKANVCTVKSPLSSMEIRAEEPFALMIGITTNGGLKVIGLFGDCELKQEGVPPESLSPGELVFALPEGFSRKMSVELSTLMVTSKLMTGFQQPPVYLKKLRQRAMIQALRTKKRYRAVVGDAKNSEDFEIQVLNPQNP
jgi:hypothetical protein